MMRKSYPRRNPDYRKDKDSDSALYAFLRRYMPAYLPREENWLVEIINEWQPDIVHTLGLEPASFLYDAIKPRLKKQPQWVVTARGGPEIALHRLVPEDVVRIKKVLQNCDHFIADNAMNYQYALELGLADLKVSPLGIMPGTGGVDIEALSGLRRQSPSKSRIILYPKAYECPASKAMPVLEALKLCWEKIQPCSIYCTAVIPEIEIWYRTLSPEIQSASILKARMPREQLLGAMAEARVVLMPSLIDGIPNTLYEAMATGAVPIASPLDTFKDIVKDDLNVIYARNLYPEEIAAALVKAMNDDDLVERIYSNNLSLIRTLADRKTIAKKVNDNYRAILSRG